MYSEVSKYRIQNLRSIVDSQEITLKNLNILVGKNGSGKSSFMRFFQILSQSAKAQKKAPLLFYGNEVDFGSFEESLSKQASDNFIGYSFDFILDDYKNEDSDIISISNIKISCRIIKIETDIYDLIVDIFANDDKIKLYFSEDTIKYIKINDLDFSLYTKSFSVHFDCVIPQLYYEWSLNKPRYRIVDKLYQEINKIGIHADIKNFLHDLLLSQYSNNNGALSIIISKSKKYACHEIVDGLTSDDKLFLLIKSFMCFCNLHFIIRIANDALEDLSKSIFYVGPMRLPPQRYYRISDTYITLTDPFSANVPSFINDLSDIDKDDFRRWTYKYFKFKTSTKNNAGIISITISLEDKEAENLIDVGFGYSQLLPIALQLWRFKHQAEVLYKKSNKKQCCVFLIEQPELHLHPAFQRKLLRAIVDIQSICKQNNFFLKVILETHSATLVDELGRIVDDELLALDDSIVYIFNEKNKVCEISSARYDCEGRLINWPIGFFSGD